MEMFLMALCLSLLGVVVSAVLFAATVNDGRQEEPARVDTRLVAEAPRFFTEAPATLAARTPVQVPIEVLLLQIERHVRLEQAAAESFHESPTAESLHMQTLSPLVH